MYAILAEDNTDADALSVLVKRIIGRSNASVARKGFGGCGELCRKAAIHIENFANRGATHFIVCHDSDGNNPSEIRSKLNGLIKGRIDVSRHRHFIVVPIQEIEAWMIADEEAITKAIPTLRISPVPWPERMDSPKEWLINESRLERTKPLYTPAIHNAKVADHLNIEKVMKKCSSFGELVKFLHS